MNTTKLLLVAFLLLLGCSIQSFAAFPMKPVAVVAEDTATAVAAGTVVQADATRVATQTHRSFFSRLFALPDEGGGERHYSLGLAVNLCILGILGIFGFHRLYMGYTWQGLVQFAGSLALLGAALIFISVGWWALPASYFILGGFGAVMGLWQLIDFFRLISADLQPKRGRFMMRQRGGRGGGYGRGRYPGNYY